MNAVGYCRVSTEEQAKGFSIDAQGENIKKCCESKGWNLVRLFIDAGYSGSTEERPGLADLRDRAHDGGFEMLLVTNIDRLSREPADSFPIIRELFSLGVNVATTTIPDVDSSKKEFYIVQAALIGQSKYFLMDLKEKQRMGIDQAKKQGRHLGTPPSGFFLNSEGMLEPDALGLKGLNLLSANPRIKTKTAALVLNMEYLKAWRLMKACRNYASKKPESVI